MRPAPPYRRLADLSARKALRLAACAGFLAASGCGGAPTAAPPAAPAAAAADNAGFLSPPQATRAGWAGPGGGVTLWGRAPPQAKVVMLSPDGARMEATADDDGGWRVQAPPAPGPRLFALSAQAGARTLRAEGAVALLPVGAATPALLLRSGAPALMVAAPAPPVLRLVSLDFDAGGGFAVSGSAPPGSAVGLTLDGAPAGQGKADPAGRFAVLAIAAPATQGDHLVAVRAGEGVDARIVSFALPAALTAPYRATSAPQGWRIDWSPPGGGVQTLTAFALKPVEPASTRRGAGA